MPYTLTRLSDDETRTFADWGITDASIRLASLGLDTCDLLIDGWRPESSELDFEYASEVLVKDGDLTIFYGRIQETPETRTPNSGTASYQIAGPWWYLDNIVYQQGWGEWDAGLEEVVSRNRAVVLLGMNDGGARIKTGAQIDAMLAYAIAAGAPLQIGDIFEGIELWPVVERARTVGDLIRRLL